MSDNVIIILKNCSVGLRSWCNTYCLQPYTALFVFVFMAATLHFSFFKGFYYNLFPSIFKQVDFEKMSRHRIQWLLACNLLSNFVCTFKNVAEGYIHAKNANMGGAVQSL